MKTVSISCVLLIGVMLAISLRTVDCHGHLAVPASRNLLANSEYCPHCLNAGGPHGFYEDILCESTYFQTLHHVMLFGCSGPKVVQIGDEKWPAGRHGLCGDRWDLEQPRPHEAGGRHWTGQVTGMLRAVLRYCPVHCMPHLHAKLVTGWQEHGPRYCMSGVRHHWTVFLPAQATTTKAVPSTSPLP